MSGTDLAYAPTSFLAAFPHDIQSLSNPRTVLSRVLCDVRYGHSVVWWLPTGLLCAVRYRDSGWRARSGSITPALLAHARPTLPAYALPMRCPVLTARMLRPAVPYPGTDVAYAPTSRTTCPYAVPTRCP
eukprot:1609686-Rhodomonas_salina.1